MEYKMSIEEIRTQVVGCTRCKLYNTRKKVVPGEGPSECDIMFIGEAPGFNENEQGKPFVGAAGHFLDILLEKAGLKRDDVFITNVIKCRPPANREPEMDELEACREFLEAQISVLNPKIIVTLGRYSMAHFIENGKISQIHGHPRTIKNRLIVPMYHPAAALHQPDLRDVILEDFSRLLALLEKKGELTFQKEDSPQNKMNIEQKKEESNTEQATQLSLF